MLTNIRTDDNVHYHPVGEYERLNAGLWAAIYKGEEILKIYQSFTEDKLRITEDVFKILKTIDNDNFIRLLDYYADKRMIAYASEYINHDGVFNILDKGIDFVKHNLNQIEKLILLLTKLRIRVDDLYYRNCLCSGDNIVLVDPDTYRFVDNKINENDLLAFNYKKMLDCFKDMYLRSFFGVYSNYDISSPDFIKRIGYVFNCNIGDQDWINNVCKRLEEVKLTYYKKS